MEFPTWFKCRAYFLRFVVGSQRLRKGSKCRKCDYQERHRQYGYLSTCRSKHFEMITSIVDKVTLHQTKIMPISHSTSELKIFYFQCIKEATEWA